MMQNDWGKRRRLETRIARWVRSAWPGSRTLIAAVVTILALTQAASAGAFDVTTYHYDVGRTGWNKAETTLDWTNVNGSSFGAVASVTLDEQVDAQPPVVSAATINSKGRPNDVVFIATENDTIYAIDSGTGAILMKRSLGTPVPMSQLPGSCNNNSNNIGINSTPVIDLPNRVMYVVTYTLESAAPVFRIHELSLNDLSDVIPSVVVSAKQSLSDGTTLEFNPVGQRQRPGLLMSKGAIYAAFGSFCDYDANISRGWLLGWKVSSLTPLPNAALTNFQTASESGTFGGGSYFLSSIWMSGYGVAADSSGYLYLQTGNSNEIASDNLMESALKIDPLIGGLADYFTPSNFATLDDADTDLGSGGVMVVPDLTGQPNFAVGGGKDGRLFLYNRNHMGGHAATDVPPSVNAGGCWCGPSYFVGSDGKPRVVSSGAYTAQTWFLPSVATSPLVLEATSASLPVGGTYGFMTTVSSNGTKAGTAIIWASSRAVNGTLYLYAFKGSPTLDTLYVSPSGAWPFSEATPNVVPVAAGGKVYVASYKMLAIFGLTSAPKAVLATAPPKEAAREFAGPHYYGEIVAVDADGLGFTLALRTGATLKVDAAAAKANHTSAVLYAKEPVEVTGAQPPNSPFVASVIHRATPDRTSWGTDTP